MQNSVLNVACMCVSEREPYMAVLLVFRGGGAAGGGHRGGTVGRILLCWAGLIYAILRRGVGRAASGCGRVLEHKNISEMS